MSTDRTTPTRMDRLQALCQDIWPYVFCISAPVAADWIVDVRWLALVAIPATAATGAIAAKRRREKA